MSPEARAAIATIEDLAGHLVTWQGWALALIVAIGLFACLMVAVSGYFGRDLGRGVIRTITIVWLASMTPNLASYWIASGTTPTGSTPTGAFTPVGGAHR